MEYIDQLKQLANENRKRIINMIYKAKSGHEGGSLSIIDMLTAIYELDINFNENPRSKEPRRHRGVARRGAFRATHRHALRLPWRRAL